MLTEAYDRELIEASLRSLVDRGSVTVSKGLFAGAQRLRDGRVVHRAYEDNWWLSRKRVARQLDCPNLSSDDPRWE
jgi:hypothetical protein